MSSFFPPAALAVTGEPPPQGRLADLLALYDDARNQLQNKDENGCGFVLTCVHVFVARVFGFGECVRMLCECGVRMSGGWCCGGLLVQMGLVG